MIVSGAPRMNDDQRGRPFSGRDGEMLDNMLLNVLDLLRGEVYTAHVAMCKPKKGWPKPHHVVTCLPFLQRQIAVVAPRVILAMGTQAYKSLWAGDGATLTENRGQWQTYQGVPAMPTFHPAYLAQHPECKRDVLDDLRSVRRRLDEIASTEEPSSASQARALKAQAAAYRQRYDDQLQRNITLTQQKNELQRLLSKRRAAQVTQPTPVEAAGKAWAPIPAEVLRDLIKLCHPDGHQNDDQLERATEATKWLLDQRST
jgi:uracil-DNA glycosylase family 4